jgi:hypothetical protein
MSLPLSNLKNGLLMFFLKRVPKVPDSSHRFPKFHEITNGCHQQLEDVDSGRLWVGL